MFRATQEPRGLMTGRRTVEVVRQFHIERVVNGCFGGGIDADGKPYSFCPENMGNDSMHQKIVWIGKGKERKAASKACLCEILEDHMAFNMDMNVLPCVNTEMLADDTAEDAAEIADRLRAWARNEGFTPLMGKGEEDVSERTRVEMVLNAMPIRNATEYVAQKGLLLAGLEYEDHTAIEASMTFEELVTTALTETEWDPTSTDAMDVLDITSAEANEDE